MWKLWGGGVEAHSVRAFVSDSPCPMVSPNPLPAHVATGEMPGMGGVSSSPEHDVTRLTSFPKSHSFLGCVVAFIALGMGEG